jgi:type IV pilus assembly protein PilF
MPGTILRAGPAAFFTLVLMLVSSCASNKSTQSKQAALYFGAGTQSLINKSYTEALTNLLKANELDPDNSDIINNLGMAYYFKDQKDLAIRHLQRSLELNNKNSDARTNLASIYLKEGNVPQAEKLYKEVLADLTYDKQARTYYNLGIIELESKKNLETANTYFQLSLKEDENFCPSYFQTGIINYNRGRFSDALRNFKESSMGTCNDAPAAHYYQALSLMKLKKFTEARLKLDEVDVRFKKSIFAVKARTKLIELNELELKPENQSFQASKASETPDF